MHAVTGTAALTAATENANARAMATVHTCRKAAKAVGEGAKL